MDKSGFQIDLVQPTIAHLKRMFRLREMACESATVPEPGMIGLSMNVSIPRVTRMTMRETRGEINFFDAPLLTVG